MNALIIWIHCMEKTLTEDKRRPGTDRGHILVKLKSQKAHIPLVNLLLLPYNTL